jgi:hypothetical protein
MTGNISETKFFFNNAFHEIKGRGFVNIKASTLFVSNSRFKMRKRALGMV